MARLDPWSGAAALALSGAFWRAYTALSGALWRSLVVSGGPTPRSSAVSGGLVSSIHHVFERGGPIGKDLTFPKIAMFLSEVVRSGRI